MSDTSSFVLKIGGKSYTGWTEAHVEKAIEALCGVFGVSLVDTQPLTKSKSSLLDIRMSDPVEVWVAEQLVLSGYVEDINMSYDSGSHSIQISGRDKLCDLVDCHRPISLGNEIRGSHSVKRIVETFCRPFGITVAVADGVVADANKIETYWVVNEGETIYESMRRLCQKHYILPITMGDGILLLTREGRGAAVDAIECGVNVLKGSLRSSDKDRYSDYHHKGYQFTFNPADSQPPKPPSGTYRDVQMASRRYRPFVIMDDASMSTEYCIKRARAEAQLRAGKSRTIEYDVQGWTQSNGNLWTLNSSVQVKDPAFGMDGELWMIDSIMFDLTPSGGSTTTLSLCKPEKYKAQADITKIKLWFDFQMIAASLATQSESTP